MANKKINELDSRASLSLSDLMAVGDPSTGYLYKTTINDLKTLTGAGVISFNGRFGAVVPVEGDYALTQLGDVIITSPTSGQVLSYNGSNWVNGTAYVLPIATASILGGVKIGSGVSVNTEGVISVSTNYEAPITAGTTAQYFRGDKTFHTLNTTAVAEGTNLYYTEDRVNANTNVAANTAARHAAVTIGTANGMSLTGQELSIGLSSGSTNGALSATDYATFNNKQDALSGTGFVKISGSTISYDNSTYLSTSAASTTYIPLSGGTMTGALNGTTANFTTLVRSGNDVESWNGQGSFTANSMIFWNSNGIARFRAGQSTTQLSLTIGSTDYFRMFTNGNISIQNGGTFTDNGFKIDVTGTGRFTAALTAGSFVKSGGTSAQFLKADGSLDSSAYITSAALASYVPTSRTITINGIALDLSADRSYTVTGTDSTKLPLSGGTLTGALSGTSATFSSSVTAQALSTPSTGGAGSTTWNFYHDQYAAGDFGLWAGGTNRILINAAGNVGIGTSSPSGTLGILVGGVAEFIINQSGTGDNYYTSGTSGNQIFRTGSTERMRITSGGNVLIGTTTDAGYKLYVSGTVASTGGFFDTSDRRLKTLITDNYQAKGVENITAKLYVKNGKQELGYYAQDLQQILPSAVNEGEDGFLSLSYTQVHTAKIAYLEDKVAHLEELIKTLS